MPVAARHLIIHGKVQGVWYRNWAIDTARGLALHGWVRNRVDGSVEALVEGPAEVVNQFVTLAHQGPPAAQVVRIDTRDLPAEGRTDFTKRPTA